MEVSGVFVKYLKLFKSESLLKIQKFYCLVNWKIQYYSNIYHESHRRVKRYKTSHLQGLFFTKNPTLDPYSTVSGRLKSFLTYNKNWVISLQNASFTHHKFQSRIVFLIFFLPFIRLCVIFFFVLLFRICFSFFE